MSKQTSQQKKRPGFKEYFKGVKKEMSKVVWPTRKELTSYTVIVVAVCSVFALGFWLIDLGVLGMLKNILGVTLG